MAKIITAYQSDDGQVHQTLEDAEFADYSGHLARDIKDFIAAEKVPDKSGDIARVICQWDLWRMGGFAGWAASRRSAPAPVTATPPPSKPAAVVLAPKPDSPFRRRVAVVGLPNVHHRSIDREFGDEFKLVLLDAQQMDKLEGLKSYHKVIVLTKWAHLKTVDVLRRIGQEPLMVHGALDVLRTTLTELYIADQAA